MKNLAVVVVIVAVALAGAGCGNDDRLDTATEASFCQFVDLAEETLVDDNGQPRTWVDLVNDNDNDEYNRGVSGLATITRTRIPDAGTYNDAIVYLDRRGRAWDGHLEEGEDDPELTDDVIEAAQALDDDLGDGLCEPA